MEKETYTYEGQVYRRISGSWYDEHMLKVSGELNSKLNFLFEGKENREKIKKHEINRATCFIKSKNYDRAISLCKQYNDKDLLQEAIRKKEESSNASMQECINQAWLFDVDLIEKIKESRQTSDSEVEKEWNLGNFCEAYRKVSKDNIELLKRLKLQRTYPLKNSIGCYYLKKYIPSRDIEHASEKEKAITERIFSLKDCFKSRDTQKSKDAVINIAVEIYLSLKKAYPNETIYLCCVPPSQKGVKAPMSLCIEYICRKDFGFVNNADFLYRKYSVESAHKVESDKRLSLEEQHDSIGYSKKEKTNLKSKIVILDDIVTTGTQLRACRDILLENGFIKENISMFAYAQTFSKG